MPIESAAGPIEPETVSMALNRRRSRPAKTLAVRATDKSESRSKIEAVTDVGNEQAQ
jgi:hypothetical protein